MKDEVLTELPPKRRVKIPVRVSPEHMKVMKKIAHKIKEAKFDFLNGQKTNDRVTFFIYSLTFSYYSLACRRR
jgi:hypothetical protein